MNYGIGNIKGKSGGAIPTITIALSQMLSFSSIQLTQEQLDILESNNFINFVDVSGFSYAMIVKSQTEISNTITFSSGIEEHNGDYTYWQLFVNKTTLVATFEEKSIQASSSSPSLYQHNIAINTGFNWSSYVRIEIITDNSEEINTPNKLYNLLIAKGHAETSSNISSTNYTYKYKNCYGRWNSYTIGGIMADTSNQNNFALAYSNGQTIQNLANETISDNVIQISGATNTPAINDGGIGK